MAGSGSPRQRTPARRMLPDVAKTAALLSIITGISGTLAPVYPRLETFYLYLFGVLAISALSGVFAGIVAAVAAAVLYQSLFAPLGAGMLLALGASVAAGSVLKLLRTRMRREHRVAEQPPTPSPFRADEAIVAAPERASVPEIDAARQEERDRWSAEVARSVDAVHRLRDQLESTRGEAESVQAALRNQIDELSAKHTTANEQITRADALAADLNAELATARTAGENASREREAERERAAEREQALHQQYEEESEHLQRAAASAMEEIQRARAAGDELRTRLDSSTRAHDALRAELDRERQTRGGAEQGLVEIERQLRVEIERLTAGFAAATSEGEALRDEARALSARVSELEAALDQERATQQQRENEWNDNLQKIVHELASDHESDLGEAVSHREESRAEARSLSSRVHDLERALTEERAQRQRAESALNDERAAREQRESEGGELAAARLSDLEATLDQERATQQQRENEWNDNLQKVVHELSSDHENDLGEAVSQREESRAEARSLSSRVHDLERALTEERAQRQRAESALNDERAAREQREHEGGELAARIELMQEQLTDADAARGELHRVVEEERAARQQLDADWSAKLQKIVSDLATDHENDIGQAMMEREAARAEGRHLTIRIQDLQRQVQEGELVRAELQGQGDEPRGSSVDERALREQLDAEWSAKLQTIVNHLASDHEEDIGKAMEEKQAARAEARTLATRVSTLQQQIERDRQTFVAAEEKWNAIRDSLHNEAELAQKEVEALRQRIARLEAARTAPAGPSPAVPLPAGEPFAPVAGPTPEPFPPFTPPEDEQRARADVLEIAEQAHAVLKRTAPGTIPLPREERRALVLFVHHDPSMRTMWRDHLHKNGYDVLTAIDGLEGLRVATAQKPNVVVADAQMPKMGGGELCRLLKSNQETASIKVILMSGPYTNEISKEQATSEFQPDELLRKPVKFDTLQKALASLVAVHQP